jgi:hypothetical protein
MPLNRRELLSKGIASALVATFPTEVKSENPRPRSQASAVRSSEPLVVTLGPPVNLTFSESNARELTPWVNADYHINQKVRVVAQGDWRVYFRPEADGSRQEVVVEYGILAYPGNPTNVGPYTATITQRGKMLATINVPIHFYFSRWRWQSAPRPFVAHVSALIASGLLPPFGDTGIRRLPYNWKTKPYVIMGNAGVAMGMGNTGERPDIGLVTEHQAQAIMHALALPWGSADAITQVMDQAEASGSIPIHWRDQSTGRPINVFDAGRADFTTHPNDAGQPQYMNVPFVKGGWQPQITHYPALSYAPYLFTGDLYHLEELQFVAAWSVARFKFKRNQGFGQQFHVLEGRGFAWGLRHLFQAARLSPADGPEYLLPKSFFTKILENTHAWFKSAAVIQNPDPAFSVFHCVVKHFYPIGNRENPNFAPWESAFLAAVLGWAQVLGFKEWSDVYLYIMDNFVQMNNGISGWNKYVCIPYRFWLTDLSGVVFTNYSQAYKGYLELATPSNSPQCIPSIPNRLYCPAVNSGLFYPSYMRAAYVYGLLLGYKQFRTIYDWLHPAMVYEASQRRPGITTKWELVT